MRLILAALLLVLPAAAQPAPGVELRTDHYDLYAENVDAEDTGRMLEQLHGALIRHFGAAPKDRLRVEVYAGFDAYKAALARDKVGDVPAGGYYDPGTRKAFLWVQPSAYYTRQLILHEATHQFHYLAATGNKSPTGAWYVEGIAEYFGMHNWDGTTLKTGVIPAATLEDYPAQALAQFDRLDRNLQGIADGTVTHERPVGWALFHFLINNYPGQFRALAARLDRGQKPDSAWKAAMGKVRPDLARDYRAWIEKHQQPWKIVWISWQERGDRIEGGADVVGLAQLKEAATSLEAEVEVVSGSAKAGLMFGYRDGDNFVLLQILPDRQARLVRKSPGGWQTLASAPFPEAPGAPVARVRLEGATAIAEVNGQEIGRVEAEGALGLNVEGCRALFRIRR